MTNVKDDELEFADGRIRDEIADMIADWFGRAVTQPDRELALIIINRVRSESRS